MLIDIAHRYWTAGHSARVAVLEGDKDGATIAWGGLLAVRSGLSTTPGISAQRMLKRVKGRAAQVEAEIDGMHHLRVAGSARQAEACAFAVGACSFNLVNTGSIVGQPDSLECPDVHDADAALSDLDIPPHMDAAPVVREVFPPIQAPPSPGAGILICALCCTLAVYTVIALFCPGLLAGPARGY